MKCISVDDYCATIPSPGKGYVDMKLLNEIIARLNKLQSEITRFRSDLTNIIVDILTTAKDNFLCKISTLKGIIDSPLFQRVVGLSVKDIASRLEGENAEKYKILMNLSGIIGKSITDIGKSVAEKSMIGRATFDEMKTFIKGWFNTFNYLDYQLFGYFLYYKLNYCAGKTKSDFMGFINEIIQKQIDSSSPRMIQEIRDIRKKILQSLYKCFYSGEELLQCLDISYAIDSNYEVIKDSVHEFFTLIGKDKKIELSHLDEVIKEFEKAGYKKLWEVWGTEIENVCTQIGRDDKFVKDILGDWCVKINGGSKIRLSYIQKYHPDNPLDTIKQCTGGDECRLCYDIDGSYIQLLERGCDKCKDNKDKEMCKGVVSAVNVVVRTEKKEGADKFINKWKGLIKILEQKVCLFEQKKKDFCQDINSHIIKELMAFERKLHKRRLDDLLGKSTNGFLERRIKEFIKNMNTANVDCNDL